MNISHNSFHGQIPSSSTQFRFAGSVKVLDISNCNYTGQDVFGEAIGRLSSLQELFFDGNTINMDLPASLEGLQSLSVLSGRHSSLTGQIPDWIGRLTSLEQLFLSGNELSGLLPTTLGNLGQLQVLELNDNFLNGNLPNEFERLTNLRKL